MAKGANQKLKMLYLSKIFMEETDDEHPLTLQEIIARLGVYDVNADRKTLYLDFEELRRFGLDIISEHVGHNTFYSLASREFELPELAEMFFMDKNTLTRQFKRVTGMTPAECIRRKRLDAAHTMISHGAGITESCHECGFSDYSAFYRAFRQTFGISPSACTSLPESGVRLHREK